jgi:hypothetical protein
VLLYRCTAVPLYRCTAAPLHRCTAAPLYRIAKSGSYIAKLIDHVHKLSARANPSPAASGPTPQDPAASTPTSVVKNEFFKTDPVASEPHPEHYFAEAAGSYRYLGSEACLVKSPRQKAKELHWPVDEDDDWRISIQQSDAKNYELVEVFIEQIQSLYPILDLSARYLASELPSDLNEVEMFHLNMIYSIGCHVTPLILSKKIRQQEGFGKLWYPADDKLWNTSGRHTYRMAHTQNYTLLAHNYLETAELYIEAATADATIEGLRAILLLAINSLFDPLKGNIGQQIALATRLALALEQKGHELSPSEMNMVRCMHTAIFSLENEIATVLDRPATFPEPVSLRSLAKLLTMLTLSRMVTCVLTSLDRPIMYVRSIGYKTDGVKGMLPLRPGH